jgi:serine/threonine protein kinase
MDQRVGKYELKKSLGKGASGTVYLATDMFTEQDVALKVIDPALISDPEFGEATRRQFMNEASLAGRLVHPHIAAILEASVGDSSGYVAVEYVPGGTLAQFCSPETLLPAGDVLEIAFKCCGALDYAYRLGIVHRDLKPSNLMLVEGTMVKIVDFGAAFLHRALNTQLADVGSPLYMSPEQIRGDTLGYQSDMFSLGVVLYELLTGQRPFVAPSLTELFQRILQADPVAPSALRPQVDPKLDAILLRMLRKLPEERYASWADLALDLADIGHLSIFQQAIPDSEKFVALRKIPLLKGLNEAEIWELVSTSRWRRVPAQTVIVREGEAGASLLLLGSGEA